LLFIFGRLNGDIDDDPSDSSLLPNVVRAAQANVAALEISARAHPKSYIWRTARALDPCMDEARGIVRIGHSAALRREKLAARLRVAGTKSGQLGKTYCNCGSARARTLKPLVPASYER
jgi:hypothetical protein